MQPHEKHVSFDVMRFLSQRPIDGKVSIYHENQIVYSQGDPADSVFYVHRGKVKVTVISKPGSRPSSQSGDRTNSAARER